MEVSANRGKLIADATCAPADIRYSTDVSLLNEAREKTDEIIDELHTPLVGKEPRPQTYRVKGRRRFIAFTKKRRPGNFKPNHPPADSQQFPLVGTIAPARAPISAVVPSQTDFWFRPLTFNARIGSLRKLGHGKRLCVRTQPASVTAARGLGRGIFS